MAAYVAGEAARSSPHQGPRRPARCCRPADAPPGRRARGAADASGAPAGAEPAHADGAALWWRGERLLRERARGAPARRAQPRERDGGGGRRRSRAACPRDAVVDGAARASPGVAHRLEEVASVDGVLYVNDSKATNVASTLVALRAFAPGSVHLILGGRGKGQDFAPLRDEVAGARPRAAT